MDNSPIKGLIQSTEKDYVPDQYIKDTTKSIKSLKKNPKKKITFMDNSPIKSVIQSTDKDYVP